MTESRFDIDAETHESLGKSLFNRVWDLMETPNRSPAQDDEMIHVAHASRLHWQQAGGGPVEMCRGEWIISRMYSVLERAEPALFHATRAAALCDDHSNIGAFDRAYVQESLGRAAAISGSYVQAISYIAAARKLAERVESKENQKAIHDDLATIKTGH